MNSKIFALGLSLLAGACTLIVPAISHAGNVGYYQLNGGGSCSGLSIGSPAAAIVAAGHTPVPIATLDAASLAPLGGLVVSSLCTPNFSNQAVRDAVANGLVVFFDVELRDFNLALIPANLPGTPALTVEYRCEVSGGTDLAPGSPIATGPAGVLTNTSLDSTGSYCSAMGTFTSTPAGSIPLLINQVSNGPSALSYSHGNGRVAISLSQNMYSLPGGFEPGYFPGTDLLYSNVVAWLMGYSVPSTTCASEGYKGAQLTWCKNICENGLTGQVLDSWIHRWINRYRQLPYCGAGGDEGGEGGEGGLG